MGPETMNGKQVLIYGSGGHGRVILDILQNMTGVSVAGFIDDNACSEGEQAEGVRVLGTSADLPRLRSAGIRYIVIAVGDNYIRARLFDHIIHEEFEPFNAIHPRTIISNDVVLGRGVVVMPGAVINTGTKIGDNACINTSASIDHDNRIGHHTHVYPGAILTGGVSVGDFSYIGTNATINPYLSVGEHVMIGSGAVVTSDIADCVTAVGIPARIIKRKETLYG